MAFHEERKWKRKKRMKIAVIAVSGVIAAIVFTFSLFFFIIPALMLSHYKSLTADAQSLMASGEYSQALEAYAKARELRYDKRMTNNLDINTSIRFDEIGEYKFGGYWWRVLDIQDGKALLITENIHEKRAFHEGGYDGENMTEIEDRAHFDREYAKYFEDEPGEPDTEQQKSFGEPWETCTLRQYLNGKFYEKFSPADQARITEVENSTDGSATTDKIFLLSFDEANQYFANNAERTAMLRESGNETWWLRSTRLLNLWAGYIDYNGSCEYRASDSARSAPVGSVKGVRPAMWVTL